jgi:two-component system nitrate/nitrite response regulator NarL
VAVRCLIVDDNERFLCAARHLLEGEGIAVVGVASTSAEAIGQVNELRPDVVLMDIDLGGEDGFDVADRLGSGSEATAPVIMISTYADGEFDELVAGSTALGFLSKSDLSGRRIHEVLARRQHHRQG